MGDFNQPPARLRTAAKRLWARCRPDGDCLVWQGAMSSAVTGSVVPVFYLRGRRMPARRVAWEVTYGGLPAGRWFWRVTCDNPRCLNVDHLYPVTATERTQGAHESRINRLRQDPALLSKIAQAKRLRATGLKYREMEAKMGVPWRTLWTWANGNNWTWISAQP